MSADDDRAAFVAWANGPDGIRGPRGADKGLRRVTAHLASPIHEVEEWARLAWSAAIAAEREACLKVTPVSPDYERHAQSMVERGHQGVADIARLAEGAFGDGVSRTLAAIRARGAS